MVASCWGLSIVAIAALFIGGGVGATMSGGLWPAIAVLPLIGLPLGIALMLAYIIVSSIRRSRASRDA